MANLLEMFVRGQAGPGTPPLAAGLLGPPEPPRPPNILDGGGRSTPSPAAAPGVGAPAGVTPGGAGQPAASPGAAGADPDPEDLEDMARDLAARRQRSRRQADADVPLWRRGSKPGQKGLGTFARLLSGESIPGLTKSEQDIVKREALLTAGLSMLGANARGTSLGHVIATGALMGRQAATETAGALLDERKRQVKVAKIRQAVDDPSMTELEKWNAVRDVLLKQGDLEGVKVATDVRDELRELEEGEGEAEFQVENGQGFWVNEQTREVRDMAGNVVLELPEGPKDESERLDRINQLADDARRELGPVLETHRLASAALEAPEQDPAAQQTMIMALNKLLDPGSVVRESEFARVAEMGGLTAEAQAYWNRLTKEGQLPPEVEQSIRQEIERLHRANVQELQSVQEHWRRRAVDAGVQPELVFRAVTTGPAGQPGSGPGGGGGESGGGRRAPTLFPEDEEGGN